jgi:DNA-directed RNA polymerase subunit K/omega
MPDTNISPIDLSAMTRTTGNIYKTVSVVGKRANQIAAATKAEITEKMADFIVLGENIEEVVENREQIEIAKHYESLPKPTLFAIEDYVEGRVFHKDNAEVVAE